MPEWAQPGMKIGCWWAKQVADGSGKEVGFPWCCEPV